MRGLSEFPYSDEGLYPNSDSVFGVSAGGLWSVSKHGAKSITILDDPPSHSWYVAQRRHVVADEHFVYWLHGSRDHGSSLRPDEGTLRRVPLAGGNIDVLGTAGEGAGYLAIVNDERYLYSVEVTCDLVVCPIDENGEYWPDCPILHCTEPPVSTIKAYDLATGDVTTVLTLKDSYVSDIASTPESLWWVVDKGTSATAYRLDK